MAQSVGPYELEETLGTGALGVTHRALDTRTGAVVALKVVHPQLLRDSDVVARLEHEVRIASQLDHPNIARIIEQGTDRGACYVATEFARGETLRARLRREERLSEAATYGIALCVVHALNAASFLRVCHRNLTPENIILGDDGELKVCDFDLTRALDATTPTRVVPFVVAAAYAAPELEERRGDIRSDLYSLGAIMFEALTGRVPADGAAGAARKNASQSADAALLRRVSPSLARIVQRLLERDAKDRYADAEQLIQALQTVGRLESSVVSNEVAAPPTAPVVAAAAMTQSLESAPDAPPPQKSAPPSEPKPKRRFGLFGNREEKQLNEYADRMLEDDVISEPGEQSLMEFASSLGISSLERYPAIQQRMTIARVNDGRLPVVAADSSRLVLLADEVVHLEMKAALLDEAVVGEWRGLGVDFVAVRGARYRPSARAIPGVANGKADVDRGVLSVTSQRVVFTGSRTTQESAFANLEFLRVYGDALGIAASNRQNRSTYRLLEESGEVVAAVVNAAVQKWYR